MEADEQAVARRSIFNNIAAAAASAAGEKGLGKVEDSFDQNIKSYAERFSGVFRYESQHVAPGAFVEVRQRKTHIGGACYDVILIISRFLRR
jgi:hypothetical protein